MLSSETNIKHLGMSVALCCTHRKPFSSDKERSLRKPFHSAQLWRIHRESLLCKRRCLLSGSRSPPGSYMTLTDKQALKRHDVWVCCVWTRVNLCERGVWDQQHYLNGSLNAVAHYDFTALRWAVLFLFTLFLIITGLFVCICYVVRTFLVSEDMLASPHFLLCEAWF